MSEAPTSDPGKEVSGALPSRTYRRGQIRLAISIPALLVLFTLAYGIVSLKLFDWYGEELQRLGGPQIAARILRDHLYTLLGLSVLALLTGLGLAFAILRPIAAIRDAAQRVAGGNLDLRAPRVPSAPELGDLSRSFNSLIEFVNESIEERNRYLVDGIITGLLTTDKQGKITALNNVGAGILGVESSSLIGWHIHDLRDRMPSKFRPLWDYLDESHDLEKTRMPDEIALGSSRERKSLLVAASPLRDAKGRPAGFVLNFRDAAEIRTLTRQLSKTDQLAALGTFMMGMAHELRNPLGSIKGIAQLLRMGETSEKDRREYLDRMVSEINRLDQFVRELLDFSQQTLVPPVMTTLRDVLRSAARLSAGVAEQYAGKGIELVEDFNDSIAVMAEPDRLARAFTNLIRNAYEAAAPGSRITLRTRERIEDGESYVLAFVHNTGSTIAAPDQAKIFDPFFTTKEKGTGLGLAIAHQIIIQQHGTLEVSVGPDEVTFITRFKAPVEGLHSGCPPPSYGIEHSMAGSEASVA